MLNKNEIASRAAGHWRWIVTALCPGMTETNLSGQHGPCPKCGGNDRFRVLADFDKCGAVLCNQCFREKNGDGFATLGWFNGWDFPTALKRVDELLNASPPLPATKPVTTADKRSPFDRWQRQAATEVELRAAAESFARTKQGVSVDAILASEPELGYFPRGPQAQHVIGFTGYRGQKKSALHLYRVDGEHFPALKGLPERKSHNVGGSQASWIFVGGRNRFKAAEFVWRVEGLTDGFALLPFLPLSHAVVTNSTGCAWSSGSDRMPPTKVFSGKTVYVAGDADTPGQDGALAFAKDVEKVAANVRIVSLPYPIADTHGPDLRDWLKEGERSFGDIEKLLTDLPREIEADPLFEPTVFSNFEIVGSGDDAQSVALTMPVILRQLPSSVKRVGRELFVDQGQGAYCDRIYWIKDETQLFGWLGSHLGTVPAFKNSVGFHSKKEVFSEARRTVEGFDAVQMVPHEPKLPRCYYACEWPNIGEGEHLSKLLEFFCPHGPIDHDLIRALFMTAIWGGPDGKRPVFAVTADGPGSGKSALVAVLAELVGGLIELSKGEDFDRFKARLLSSEGRRKRLVLFDNVKSWRLSWPQLESLVTAPVISGRQNNIGESSRPNDLLWVLTGNGLSTGKDISQRSIIIRLSRPKFSGDWDERVMQFVREHREQLIGDLIGSLRQPPSSLADQSRWGPWNSGVLTRLPKPDEAQGLIAERQVQIDVEVDEAEDVIQCFSDELHRNGFRDDESVFIAWKYCLPWCATSFGKVKMTATDAGRRVQAMFDANSGFRVKPMKHRQIRGVLWNPDAAVDRPPKIFGEINPIDTANF